MDCKNIEKLIPKFLKDECTPKEEALILAHIKECVECKEELTIEFLLAEGLNRLESGESFDLNAELEKRLKEKTDNKKKRQMAFAGGCHDCLGYDWRCRCGCGNHLSFGLEYAVK